MQVFLGSTVKGGSRPLAAGHDWPLWGGGLRRLSTYAAGTDTV